MSISDMTVSMATFKARLQGAEGVTLGDQHTSPEPWRAEVIAVSAHRRVLVNHHHRQLRA